MSRYNSQEKNEKLLEDVTSSIDRTEFETKVEDINVSTNLHLSRDSDYFLSCYNEDCVVSGLVNDIHDEVKLLETDSESFKSVNSDLDTSMLFESYSTVDFQIWDQKDQCRSKESGGKISHGLIMLEGAAGAQCQGTESFTGRREEPSSGLVESVSKIMEEPNRYFHTCSNTGDIEYGNSYSVPRTMVREDIEASRISSTCNGFEQDNVIPTHKKVAISSIAKPTADEYISPAFGNVDNSSNQGSKNVEVVDDPQVESSDEVKDQSLPAPERKPQGKALLKNLVKGTAVIGTLIFLVQMRRSIKHGTLERKTQSIKRQEGKGGKLLSRNRQRVDKIDSLYDS